MTLTRRMTPDGPEVISISSHQKTVGDVQSDLVTGEWWIYAHVTLCAGALTIGGLRFSATGASTFAIFLPPYSFASMVLHEAEARTRGLAGLAPIDARGRSHAVVCANSIAPEGGVCLDEMRQRLANGIEINADARASTLAKKARQSIRGVRSSRHPLRDLARQLGVAPETLSRHFKKSYGLTLKAYIHRGRISDGLLHVAAGTPIIESASASGFDDLSRFYQQFRRITRNTPAQYRP